MVNGKRSYLHYKRPSIGSKTDHIYTYESSPLHWLRVQELACSPSHMHTIPEFMICSGREVLEFKVSLSCVENFYLKKTLYHNIIFLKANSLSLYKFTLLIFHSYKFDHKLTSKEAVSKSKSVKTKNFSGAWEHELLTCAMETSQVLVTEKPAVTELWTHRHPLSPSSNTISGVGKRSPLWNTQTLPSAI